jgi:hypothetical protein
VPIDPDDAHRLDENTAKAETEIQGQWQLWSAVAVAKWWTRWYPLCGHKRLGRVLLNVTGPHPGRGISLANDNDLSA